MRQYMFLPFVVLAIAATASAQSPRWSVEPDIRELECRRFRIRVVNGTRIRIYYKLVGGVNRGYAYQTLRPGSSETDVIHGGERVLCVWNMEGRVIAVAVVLVDRNGKVVIRAPQVTEAPSGPVGGEIPPVLRLRVEPEG